MNWYEELWSGAWWQETDNCMMLTFCWDINIPRSSWQSDTPLDLNIRLDLVQETLLTLRPPAGTGDYLFTVSDSHRVQILHLYRNFLQNRRELNLFQLNLSDTYLENTSFYDKSTGWVQFSVKVFSTLLSIPSYTRSGTNTSESPPPVSSLGLPPTSGDQHYGPEVYNIKNIFHIKTYYDKIETFQKVSILKSTIFNDSFPRKSWHIFTANLSNIQYIPSDAEANGRSSLTLTLSSV